MMLMPSTLTIEVVSEFVGKMGVKYHTSAQVYDERFPRIREINMAELSKKLNIAESPPDEATPEEEASWSNFLEENNDWIFSMAKEAREAVERGEGISLEKGFGFTLNELNRVA